MHRQIWDNRSLTKIERTQLLDEVANQAIFGVDAGREPVVARIARINMYLHADRVLVGRHRSARRRGAPSERGKAGDWGGRRGANREIPWGRGPPVGATPHCSYCASILQSIAQQINAVNWVQNGPAVLAATVMVPNINRELEIVNFTLRCRLQDVY
jgi:hypothetical protein